MTAAQRADHDSRTTPRAVGADGHLIAAWVAGEPVPLREVDDREAALRSSTSAAVLPARDTSEGRQFRRWLVQVLVAERLVARESVGLDVRAAPPLAELAPSRAALLRVGSVAAAVLRDDPAARAVFRAVTGHVTAGAAAIERFYLANPELFARPASRLVRHALLAEPRVPDDLDGRPVRTLRRGELVGPVEDAVFAAEPGGVVGPVRDALGWHALRVLASDDGGPAPLSAVRGEIDRRLTGAARLREFAAWLDRRRDEDVRLAPGWEHPGDPSQPDNTHRH
ncbi:peptidylprolyl isomerase [Solihabitans fulvus]|uniref:peptidylprolyl isomerase n=1 Tax=Solihabitans fulvus TaxID=1892852 RepID=UPI001CB75EE3|nr:peptidylprolyl isomerase [Solihabitans fulvus]